MARKVAKEFTYYSLIKEAINSYSGHKATSAEIFNYVRAKHPDIFKRSNSMTWQGNIRQLLSKHPEFQKIGKSAGSKLNYWIHKPIEVIEAEENQLNAYLKDPPKFISKYKDAYLNYDQYGYYWIDYWNGPEVIDNFPNENWYNRDKEPDLNKKY